MGADGRAVERQRRAFGVIDESPQNKIISGGGEMEGYDVWVKM